MTELLFSHVKICCSNVVISIGWDAVPTNGVLFTESVWNGGWRGGGGGFHCKRSGKGIKYTCPERGYQTPTHFAISVRTMSLRSSYAAAKVVGRMTDVLGL